MRAVKHESEYMYVLTKHHMASRNDECGGENNYLF